MRRLKNHKTYLWMILWILCLSCTKDFREINTDLSGITDEDMKVDFNNIGIPLDVIQQGIYFNYDFGKGKNWTYQLTQNLNADMFSGYMHDYKPHNGGSSNSDYNLQNGWNGTCWSYTYAYIFPQIKRSEDSTRIDYPSVYAMTKILKVEAMHRVSDIYGPIVYSDFGDESGSYMPDTQKEVYMTFFDELDEAVDLLTAYIRNKNNFLDISKFDILLDGKPASWIKFANSLRLRLAIRISSVAPDKGKEECEKALRNSYGVFEGPKEQAAVSTRNGYLNPLGEINRVWDEVYMNASMESILNGYEDPRRESYFEPCVDNIYLKNKEGADSICVYLKGQYKGIRQGTCFSHLLYASHSKIYVNQSTDAVLMTAAEVWFLRAEAALRGWTAEDPETCYREGVKTSFRQWGVGGVEEYLESRRTGADYIDAFDASNNIKARCRVFPKWEESDSREVKLEKIITQKWLAIFPEGCEAWAEQRRTGYPRLFPVKFNNSPDWSIDTEIMIRRLNFPGEIKDSDPMQYNALVKALGAPDNAGTRLWWDTGKNF